MASYFVSTPIYYVNARPHLGHAYTTIVTDSLVRMWRLSGHQAFFGTGTDEHGDKIVQAAEKAGLAPKEFVDQISNRFRELWPHLNVEYDHFIRTTDSEHIKKVQAFLQRVYDNGDIYFGEFAGHYCYGCERFYTEKELENGLCPQHATKPEYINEKNYFFKMSKYLPWLKEHIKEHPDFIQPERYRNEVMALLESEALGDLCISRPKSRLTWGIELPFDQNYVCYVWFDALLNYISMLDWPDGDNFQKFWPGEHIVAKDILKPHAIFWPCMLKSAGVDVYKYLHVHGYWLVREAKMSKSLGNVIEPLEMCQKFGADAFRYFLLREMHFGSDANCSDKTFIQRYNSDLANDLGNLFSRVLSVATKFTSSKVPQMAGSREADLEIVRLCSQVLPKYQAHFLHLETAQALETLWELVRALNRYVDAQAPWNLYKNNELERLGTVLQVLLISMRKIAIALWPVMPQISKTLLAQLGQKVAETGAVGNLSEELGTFTPLAVDTPLATSSNLFPRMEMPKEESLESKKEAKKEKSKSNVKDAKSEAEIPAGYVSFEQFKQVEIRMGKIIAAEQHPNADKLLVLQVDFGALGTRQILSGIAEHFQPENLVGQVVCAVVNLPERKMRGLASQGLILTCESEGKLQLIGTKEMALPGSLIS